MKLSLVKKIIIIIFALNFGLVSPVLAQMPPSPSAAPTPPPAPTAPPAPPSPPAAPTPPPAPTAPPAPPSPPAAPTSPPAPGTASSPDPSSQPTDASQVTNTDTGAGSTNESAVENQTNTTVQNENDGQVDNTINSQVMTGGNIASGNTGGGQIVTGDAIQSINVITNLNQNTTLVYSDDSVLNQASNQLTGAGSNNNSEITNKLNNVIQNSNLGSLTNKITANSISGLNYSSYNTGSGSVQAGDAKTNLSLISAVNTNVTGTGGMKTFNIYDIYKGDLVFKMSDFADGTQFANGNPADAYQQLTKQVAENAATGADSTNNAEASQSQTDKTDNTNQGVLKNDIVINAISGDNNTVKNTGSGDIETGDAQAVGTVINFLNTNLNVKEWAIAVVNVFGQLIGDIILPQNQQDTTTPAGQDSQQLAANSVTGADSQNNADTDNQSSVVFSNYNNAQVMNNVETTAITGANTASYNTGPGQVVDGDATVSTQVATSANNNVNGGDQTLWLILVNKMGQWVGQIVGADTGETLASNLILSDPNTPTPQANNNSQPQGSVNQDTGADSENNANTSNSNTYEFTNQNTGSIENNIKVVADSGKNNGSSNTLGGDVQAGDAQAGVSLVNFVNNNLYGKKLMVLVVNVLGSWLGDAVPPEEEKETKDQNFSQDEDVGDLPPDLPFQGNPEPNNFDPNNDGTKNPPQIVARETEDNPSQDQQTGDFNVSGDYAFAIYSGRYTSSAFDELTVAQRVNYRRGLFVSTVFAKETASDSAQASGAITTDWLYIILPSFLGVVLSRNKKLRTALLSFL